MNNYELMFIITPDVDEESITEIRNKLQTIITSNGGEVAEVKDMGKRRLAYEINKHREAVYTLMTFKASAEIIRELERVINITEAIVRHMVSNINDLVAKA